MQKSTFRRLPRPRFRLSCWLGFHEVGFQVTRLAGFTRTALVCERCDAVLGSDGFATSDRGKVAA